jgi:UDP-N-acetyl-D-glucosamine/UDP-N-acetyl-D-galactosamine dehydrogenase
MGQYVASEVVKLMIKKSIPVKGAKVLMLGITFKENCPDIRNTKAIDIYHELKDYGMEVDLYDPWANPAEVKHEYGINILSNLPPSGGTEGGWASIILAVAHNEFLDIDLKQHQKDGAIIYDVKGILDSNVIDGRL